MLCFSVCASGTAVIALAHIICPPDILPLLRTSPQADKDSLLSALTAMEDWLYDEGEDCGKSVYVAKLDELKKTGDPIEMRWAAATARLGLLLEPTGLYAW